MDKSLGAGTSAPTALRLSLYLPILSVRPSEAHDPAVLSPPPTRGPRPTGRRQGKSGRCVKRAPTQPPSACQTSLPLCSGPRASPPVARLTTLTRRYLARPLWVGQAEVPSLCRTRLPPPLGFFGRIRREALRKTPDPNDMY